MPKYYDCTLEDFKELHNICGDLHKVNEFRDRHYHYTCSHCGKDELYIKSPILHDELWAEVVKKLGIDEKNVGPSVGRVTNFGTMNHEQRAGYRFYKLFDDMTTTESDDTYTMLCRECMEKSLGRPLYKEDLLDCGNTRKIINDFKNDPKK